MGERSSTRGVGRGRWLAAAVALLVLDTAFFVLPLAALLVFYVVVVRPRWFRREVERLYDRAD